MRARQGLRISPKIQAWVAGELIGEFYTRPLEQKQPFGAGGRDGI